MNLSNHEYLKGKVQKYLGDDGEILSFFFDEVINFLASGVLPKFPAITISKKRDMVFILKNLDSDIRDLNLVVSWEPSIPPTTVVWREYQDLPGVARTAFAELENTSVTGLFCFYVLATIFYGGIFGENPGSFIDDTFPFDVFEALKPYVVAKKLSKEFSAEEISLAQKSVDDSFTPMENLPPYAAYVTLAGKHYLVYDVLKGIKW